MNTNRSLIAVLLLALFSLTALQGINILINRNNILGENTGTGSTKEAITPPRCIESKGICSLNCKTGEKPVPASDCSKTICCVPITNSPTSPPSKPTTSNIPCAEIEKIQHLYCSDTGLSPLPSVSPASTSTSSACKTNGDRRCRGQAIEICLNNTWKLGETCEKYCSVGHCLSTAPTPKAGTTIPSTL